MARPRRIEFPGARLHVLARGNERRTIIVCDADRRHFEELLAGLPARRGVLVQAWVLMANPYHCP